MLRIRTKFLLASIVLFGLGIGVFSSFSDGLYSAVCLFFLPILVALAGESTIVDLGQNSEAAKPSARKVATQSHDRFDLPHAA